jgi:hypothetical protein
MGYVSSFVALRRLVRGTLSHMATMRQSQSLIFKHDPLARNAGAESGELTGDLDQPLETSLLKSGSLSAPSLAGDIALTSPNAPEHRTRASGSPRAVPILLPDTVIDAQPGNTPTELPVRCRHVATGFGLTLPLNG